MDISKSVEVWSEAAKSLHLPSGNLTQQENITIFYEKNSL